MLKDLLLKLNSEKLASIQNKTEQPAPFYELIQKNTQLKINEITENAGKLAASGFGGMIIKLCCAVDSYGQPERPNRAYSEKVISKHFQEEGLTLVNIYDSYDSKTYELIWNSVLPLCDIVFGMPITNYESGDFCGNIMF